MAELYRVSVKLLYSLTSYYTVSLYSIICNSFCYYIVLLYYTVFNIYFFYRPI